MKSSLLFGAVAAAVCFAPGAFALSPAEVEQRAKAVSVEMLTGEGSGVIIHRQGDLYTVITNRHVVCKVRPERCTEELRSARGEREIHASYRLKTSDSRIYQVARSNIKLLKDDAGKFLDLAIVQFRSNRSYPVAQAAEPGSLKADDDVYTAGFPRGQGWLFGAGKAQAVVNKRLVGDRGGYTVVYNAETLPGMSGGGAFDQDGRLVAVHGYGDRYTENTQAEEVASSTTKNEVNSKIGYNRGIPVRWVVQGLGELGILVGNRKPLSQIRVDNPTVAATADEFFIAGFNKYVDPGANFQAGRREAVAQFNQAVALNPRYAIAYFMRAIVKNRLNDPQGALADYNQNISLNPKLENAYNNRGNLKDDLNDSKGALADYNQAISLNPKFALAYSNRGVLKAQKLNDPKGSLVDYNQSISLNPKFAAAYNNRGSLKDDLNDSKGALADYNQAISLNPKFAIAYNNRGFLKYEKLDDAQGALADFNQSISLNPKYAEAYNNRGNLKYPKLDDPKGALADFNQSISLNPKFALAYNNRGVLKYPKLDDPKGALADFNQAISLNPKYAEAYYNRGILQKALNYPEGALADYNQSISLNPKFADAYYNRGILKAQKLNDPQGALADYNQSISLNPQNAKAYNNRGILKHEKLNDPQGALADFNQAISLTPQDAKAYYNREVLKYKKLNDTPGAIADFRTAAKLARAQGQTDDLQRSLEALRILGTTENP
jgi:tetratricopeptide (TPR) repeat protein